MNPCLLIPIFDHKDEISGVVRGLAAARLRCLIVDDGSNDATRSTLAALEEEHAWVSVHQRKQNGGRGAALKTGYRLAQGFGFSHVIQLDADGQHDPADVPRFVAEITRHPRALILGRPRFDATAPKSRLYGRQLSRAMVWLATLSFDVADPLCGYRAIPLAPLVDLIDAVATGDAMEFDPELVIRLHWSGMEVRNLPVRVVYNPGGLSHFDLVADNLRLARVYARSLAGMPLRLPARLRRRSAHSGGRNA